MSQVSAQEAALQASAENALRLSYEIDIILNGIRPRSHAIADEVVRKIVNLLTSGEAPQGGITSDAGNVVSLNRASELPLAENAHIEDFIFQCLTDATDAMSVQQLFDLVKEAGYEVSRPTFVVRLHRMQKAGRLIVPTTGHYRLPDKSNRQSR
jgi:hypothetical protein